MEPIRDVCLDPIRFPGKGQEEDAWEKTPAVVENLTRQPLEEKIRELIDKGRRMDSNEGENHVFLRRFYVLFKHLRVRNLRYSS